MHLVYYWDPVSFCFFQVLQFLSTDGHATTASPSHKVGLKTGIILITWNICKEINMRIFNDKFSMSFILFHFSASKKNAKLKSGSPFVS